MAKTVVVGMSGGVDSSLAAWLLKEQGYHVIGLFMKNWEEDDKCPAAQDLEDVAAVCGQIDIPYYTVNFSKEYWERVFAYCLKQYEQGFTPNPDIYCNREIKFKLLLEKAIALGGDFLATGHYCRNMEVEGRYYLARGVDPAKDQSYFLYTLKERILQKALFPLGGMHKKEVRALAKKLKLHTAEKKDSTGICFIGKRDFKEFLERYIPPLPGNFERVSGEVVGRHDGIAYYTIGQRRGLVIGGKGEAWYVVGKDPARNVVFVEQGEENPALLSNGLIAKEISWVGDFPTLPLSCSAKVRYRTEDVPCEVLYHDEESLEVRFARPIKAVTPHQAIVFYQNDICLGGAQIIQARSCF